MKTIAKNALDQLRRRGFDEALLKDQYDTERAQDAQKLCETIKNAFAGVALGNGIGLYQAQAIDAYKPVEIELD